MGRARLDQRRAVDVDRRLQFGVGDVAARHGVPVRTALRDPLETGVERDVGNASRAQQRVDGDRRARSRQWQIRMAEVSSGLGGREFGAMSSGHWAGRSHAGWLPTVTTSAAPSEAVLPGATGAAAQ